MDEGPAKQKVTASPKQRMIFSKTSIISFITKNGKVFSIFDLGNLIAPSGIAPCPVTKYLHIKIVAQKGEGWPSPTHFNGRMVELSFVNKLAVGQHICSRLLKEW